MPWQRIWHPSHLSSLLFAQAGFASHISSRLCSGWIVGEALCWVVGSGFLKINKARPITSWNSDKKLKIPI